ncbi:hypothetical protein CBL_03521 [Carabus blaptoides fortunei]
MQKGQGCDHALSWRCATDKCQRTLWMNEKKFKEQLITSATMNVMKLLRSTFRTRHSDIAEGVVAVDHQDERVATQKKSVPRLGGLVKQEMMRKQAQTLTLLLCYHLQRLIGKNIEWYIGENL